MEVQSRVQLPELARSLGLPMKACLVGVAEGYDAADLLRGGLDHLFLIDVWEHHPEIPGDAAHAAEWHNKNYQEAMERINPYKARCTILRGLSNEMVKSIPDNSLGLCYLDACHDFEYVWDDLTMFFPKLVNGGIMSGHDFLNENYGVKAAVEKFCKDKYSVHTIPENGDPANASFYFIK